jgi:ribonuclease R
MLNQALKILKEYPKQLEELISQDIISKDGEEYTLNSKYYIGQIQINKNDAKLITSNQHQKIPVEFGKLHGAYDGDIVIAKRSFHPRNKYKATIIQVLNTNEQEILVCIDENKYVTLKDSITLKTKIDPKYKQDDILLINSKTLQITQYLGNIKNSSIDEKISLHLFNQDYRTQTFDSKNIDQNIKIDEKRVDLTQLDFCTIDPIGAKDHDDAIYFDDKNFILYVAIADVSAYVTPNSELDRFARKRATSVYMPHKVLPMLPVSLSNDLCSLKPDVKRLAYVYELHLNKKDNHNIIKSKLYEAVIQSKKRFTYGRIDRILNNQFDTYTQDEKAIFDSIINLYKVTSKIRKKRLQKGYDFRSQENRLKLDKNQEIIKVEVETSSASHELIEECMLLANIQASLDIGNIGIFRIHDEPTLQKLDKLIQDVTQLGLKVKRLDNIHSTITSIQEKANNALLREEVDKLIIQTQQLATYSSKNLGHFGLGFQSYSHFTSPIRRYADLVLHRMLKTKKIPQDIDDLCDYISQTSRKVDMMVWDFEDRKYARWASKHIDQELIAKIVDTQKGLVKVDQKIIGLKATVDNYDGEKLFSTVRIKIKSANIIHKSIIATILR